MPSRRQVVLSLVAVSGTAVFGWGALKMTHPDLAEKVQLDFEKHARRNDFASVSPREAIALMVSFQRTVSYPHDRLTPYGDTLLFEYGVFDWGRGENFDLKITRQVVFEFNNPIEADDNIIQVSLTFRYQSDPFRDLPTMTQWACDLSAPQDIELFALNSAGYLRASPMAPKSIDLYSSAQ